MPIGQNSSVNIVSSAELAVFGVKVTTHFSAALQQLILALGACVE
jgi:hypothetical protein